MRAIVQRVTEASVTIDGIVKSSIGLGLLVLVSIEDADTLEDIEWLSSKIINLRIFNDATNIHSAGNRSLKDSDGELILVSQFTLHASTKKGNRPSYMKAAKPEVAIPLYEKMIVQLQTDLGKPIQTGIFGADMKIRLLNDGPITIMLDSKERE
jgi:D-aminoacyl-tRNA deacylase